MVLVLWNRFDRELDISEGELDALFRKDSGVSLVGVESLVFTFFCFHVARTLRIQSFSPSFLRLLSFIKKNIY